MGNGIFSTVNFGTKERGIVEKESHFLTGDKR